MGEPHLQLQGNHGYQSPPHWTEGGAQVTHHICYTWNKTGRGTGPVVGAGIKVSTLHPTGAAAESYKKKKKNMSQQDLVRPRVEQQQKHG